MEEKLRNKTTEAENLIEKLAEMEERLRNKTSEGEKLSERLQNKTKEGEKLSERYREAKNYLTAQLQKENTDLKA